MRIGCGGDHKVKGKSVIIPLQIRCKSDPYIEDISPRIGSYAKSFCRLLSTTKGLSRHIEQ